MTNEEVNAAVATRIMGWHKHLIDGFWEERPGSGAVVSSWNPAGDWGYAMMAAEKWMRGDNGRRVKLHCGLHPRGGIRAAVTLHALEDKPGRGFGDGPRALCLALLQAAGETENENETETK